MEPIEETTSLIQLANERDQPIDEMIGSISAEMAKLAKALMDDDAPMLNSDGSVHLIAGDGIHMYHITVHRERIN